MDVRVALRVVDEEDRELRYEMVVVPIDPHHIFPIGFGSVNVSHRVGLRGRCRGMRSSPSSSG